MHPPSHPPPAVPGACRGMRAAPRPPRGSQAPPPLNPVGAFSVCPSPSVPGANVRCRERRPGICLTRADGGGGGGGSAGASEGIRGRRGTGPATVKRGPAPPSTCMGRKPCTISWASGGPSCAAGVPPMSLGDDSRGDRRCATDPWSRVVVCGRAWGRRRRTITRSGFGYLPFPLKPHPHPGLLNLACNTSIKIGAHFHPYTITTGWPGALSVPSPGARWPPGSRRSPRVRQRRRTRCGGRPSQPPSSTHRSVFTFLVILTPDALLALFPGVSKPSASFVGPPEVVVILKVLNLHNATASVSTAVLFFHSFFFLIK